MKKQSLAWVLALVLILSSSAATFASAEQMSPALELTLEELAQFNGQDGQPAYIAVDGIIYDVSALGTWENGVHKGIEAGQDVTEAFAGSPHEADILAMASEVGELVYVEFTLEELAQFNGKDGQPAYIAVDGVIYDVTNSNAWKNGQHNGFEAGMDLTEEIKNVSPHGIGKLDNVVPVGMLAQDLELTLEELALFNGKDGQLALIAVDGIIYDVTESKAWKNGGHNGYQAGKDLTEEIKNVSPHGISKLDNVIEVGTLFTE